MNGHWLASPENDFLMHFQHLYIYIHRLESNTIDNSIKFTQPNRPYLPILNHIWLHCINSNMKGSKRHWNLSSKYVPKQDGMAACFRWRICAGVTLETQCRSCTRLPKGMRRCSDILRQDRNCPNPADHSVLSFLVRRSFGAI